MASSDSKKLPGDQLQERKSPNAAEATCSSVDDLPEKKMVNLSMEDTRAGMIREDEPVLLYVVEGTPRALVASKKIFDVKLLPSWLYEQERRSFKLYFESPRTPRNELNWTEEAGVVQRRYSISGLKREKARRTACSFVLIKLQIPMKLKTLLSSSHSVEDEWSAINSLSDSATMFPQRKYALATDWETISVLLIRLLTGLNAHTKIKLLNLLVTLSDVYMGKQIICKLGGFRILTQAMLLGDTRLDIKKKTLRLLSSLCEARENFGCFLKIL